MNRRSAIISFRYRNWRGEEQDRIVQPRFIVFGDAGEFQTLAEPNGLRDRLIAIVVPTVISF